MEITPEVLVLPSNVDPGKNYYARIGTDPDAICGFSTKCPRMRQDGEVRTSAEFDATQATTRS
jgi:hypothetical protein